MLILIFICFLIATPCLSWVLHSAIQEGQVFGAWQKVLDRVYGHSKLLEMFLGGCYKCFSNFIAQIAFIVFLSVQQAVQWLGWWNALLYFMFVPLCIVLSMLIDKMVANDGLEDRITALENEIQQIKPDLS